MKGMFHDNNYVLMHFANNNIPYTNLTVVYNSYAGFVSNKSHHHTWGFAGHELPDFDKIFEEIAENKLLYSQELLVPFRNDNLWRLFLTQLNNRFGKEITLIRADCNISQNPILDNLNVIEIPWFEQYRILNKADGEDYSGLKRKELVEDVEFNFDLDKPFMYSLILGGEKDWRTDLYESIKDDKRILTTYRGKYPELNKSYEASEEEYNYFTYEYDYASVQSEEKINLDIGARMPSKIYENSIIDISVETYINGPILLTEKTGKPIQAKRPFIQYSSPYTLKSLRKFGYKTFPLLFDESYDEILDHNLRKEKILHEVNTMTKKRLADHKNYIQDIAEHNYDLLKSRQNNILANI